MEHTTSALIFPETAPCSHGMAMLLIFFDALSFYQATESDGAGNSGNNFFTNLCRGYAPAPLGDDLSRFKRLLRDMETGRPDEFSRLFSAAKPPGAPGQARDQEETSAARVFSALNQDAGLKASIRYKERLWQARLILKLAEMLDRSETEVRQGLAQVSSAEQEIFASLEGPGEAETDDLEELSGRGKLRYPKADDILPGEPLPGMSWPLIPLRVKAWAELYLADSSDLLPLVLVTGNPESGSLLLDGYENTWRRDPEKLFALSIPNLHPEDIEGTREQYLASRNIFRGAAQDNLEYFAGFLRETAALAGSAAANQDSHSILAHNLSAWEEKVNIHFPAPGKGSKKLHFYCFPGVSSAELLQRLFRLESPPGPASQQKYPTGILAVLKP